MSFAVAQRRIVVRCRRRGRARRCRFVAVHGEVADQLLRQSGPGGKRKRWVHSWASLRVSRNTIGTVGTRIWQSAMQSATTLGRTRSSLKTFEQRVPCCWQAMSRKFW